MNLFIIDNNEKKPRATRKKTLVYVWALSTILTATSLSSVHNIYKHPARDWSNLVMQQFQFFDEDPG